MDQLEEIKSKIDLIELISEYVPLKKTGRNFKANCPFHSEKTPSFIVSPERQIWKCFGCQKGGDHFRFLMEMETMDFGEALRTLAKRVGVKLRRYQPTEGEKIKQLLYEINHLTGEFYHFLLVSHPVGKGALDYILGRGISKKSLAQFKLGFTPDRWDSLIKFLVNKKKYRLEDIEKAGLIIKGRKGFYDRFRARLMFPLKDHRNNVCGFAGRVLDPEVKEAKYVNTPETPVYVKSHLLYGLEETKKNIKKQDEVVLVEGELDLISSYQAGIKNVVAIKGSALTEAQVRLLGRFTKNIVFALDKDLAGDAAARRGIQMADQGGMAIKVVSLKEGKDPDEVAQKNPKLWQKLVKQAVPVYDYFLNFALERFDSRSAEGKRKIGQELVPILAGISDEIVRAHYVQKLSESLGVNEGAVVQQMTKVKLGPGVKMDRSIAQTDEKMTQRESLEQYLLALALQSGQWQFLAQEPVEDLIQTSRFKRILKAVGRYLKKTKKKKFESNRLAELLPSELVATFDKLYLLELSDLLKDEEKVQKELKATIIRLERLNLKEGLEKTAVLIKAIEGKKNADQKGKKDLEKLTREFRDLSLKLTELNSN